MNAPEAQAFNAPWEAQAFALVVALCERGLFTWPEWTEALAAAVQSQRADDDGSAYYSYWLQALEQLACDKGLTSASLLVAREAAWRRATEATPHGEPILLENDPLARA